MAFVHLCSKYRLRKEPKFLHISSYFLVVEMLYKEMPVHAGALDGVLFCGAYKQAHKTVPAQKRVAAAFGVMTVMMNFCTCKR